MKLTMHNGREGSATHNDRSGRRGEHIHEERTWQNRTWQLNSGMTFQENEKVAYRELFAEWLEERNERTMAARHPERVKGINDLLKGRQSRPEEVILQVGDIYSHIEPERLWEAVKRYKDMMEYKYPLLRTLDMSMHVDEATPHVHIRRVWTYHDEEGRLAIGQEKSLQEMGVQLPHPDQAPSRYNNRKILFTADARGTWLCVCRELGIEIDLTPCNRKKHLNTLDYKLQKDTERLIEARGELNRVNNRLEVAQAQCEALEGVREELIETLKPAVEFQRRFDFIKDDPEVLEAVNHALVRMREEQDIDDDMEL